MAKSSDQDDRADTKDEPSDEPEGKDEPSDEPEGKDEPSDEPEGKDEPGEEAAAPAEDEAPAPRPRPKGKGKGKRASGKGAARAPAPPPPPPQAGQLGKSLILFLVIVGGLAAAFAFFGQETGTSAPSPKWKPGEKAQVEISLISNDKRELACLSTQEVKGRHCAFEAPAKPWSKGDPNDDKMLLRPYTTTDRVQFLAAGVWSDPVLQGTLPLSRFAIKCTFNVEGQIKRPGVRWSSEGTWIDQTSDWYAGYVSDCKMVNP